MEDDMTNPWRTVAAVLIAASALYITATYFMMY
jgi:hypothetical protein